MHEIHGSASRVRVKSHEMRDLRDQNDLAELLALIHAAVGCRIALLPNCQSSVLAFLSRLGRDWRFVSSLREKKHDGRDQVAGRGEGCHKVPTVVIRARILEGFPQVRPHRKDYTGSTWIRQAQL